MGSPKAEKAYQKHAWIILFALGIVGLAFSFLGIVGIQESSVDRQAVKYVTGMTPEEIAAASPGIFSYILHRDRTYGIAQLFVVFAMAIAAIPYRKGEKWAWYISWFIPILLLGFIANNLTAGGPVVPLLTVLLILSLLGLILPYRKFFPKKQTQV